MTGRGWWCLFLFIVMLLVGIFNDMPGLGVTGLALLLWFGWEWLFFVLRIRTLWSKLRVEREIGDERGGVSTLWEGRTYDVVATLSLEDKGRFPYLAIADPVPFGVRHHKGPTTADGELRRDEPLSVRYSVSCPQAGVARFEGLRVEVTDLQGFFCHVGFVRAPIVLRILPGVVGRQGGGPTVKRHNELPPPGIHRLRRPGSGSELLDLRDYMPGDPPRTIAWKVSARRDRLVTKEFESEVPVRCTLFLDVSSSVRVPSPNRSRSGRRRDEEGPAYFRPLDRLVELAGGVVRANAILRDLTGLCLFDERTSQVLPPARTSNHQTRLLQLLGEAAARGPVVSRADPQVLLPIAYALAQELYPDLLQSSVNAMPAWVTWVVGFPRYTRHRRGLLDTLHRSKRTLLLWATTLIPLSLVVTNFVAALLDDVPDWARSILGGLLFLGTPVLALGGWLLFLFSLLVSHKHRRLARWRKRLSALLAVRSLAAEPDTGPPALPSPGGLEALLEDDDLFSLHLQAFLAEHQVPCALPLYDNEGRYLLSLPEKVGVLGTALIKAVSRGRDNELYVLLADLLELDGQLGPLLQAVRVALGRHHRVLLVCPWPQDVPLPGEEARRKPRRDTLPGLILSVEHARLHAAYKRIRRSFARLGVQVICAGSRESVPLILDRIERLRSARRSPGSR